MFTPQQIEQISFGKQTFGGYDMQSVDEVLEPLTEDYITLYKENALLKSKMRVLVSKLEEYRKNEASMKEALAEAQQTCDKMVADAQAKCTQMLNDANAAAAERVKNTDALVAAENARAEEARRVANSKINFLTAQLQSCIDMLEQIKETTVGNEPKKEAFDFDKSADDPNALADEIAKTLEAQVGISEDALLKAEPKHPVADTTTKFANLKFGPNYDPTR